MFKKFVAMIFISVAAISCLQPRSPAFEREEKPNLELEGKTMQEKIIILKRDLASQDGEKKQRAISSLGKLGGEAVPLLLEQLTIELKKKEKVSLGGEEPKEVMSRFVRSIILSLGHTVDKRTVKPLTDIALSEELPVRSRRSAIEVLAVLGGAIPSSRFIPRAEPTEGQEVTSEDRAKIEQALTILLDSKHDVLRDEAKRAFEQFRTSRKALP